MNSAIAGILNAFLYMLMIAVVGRGLLSWFPISRNNPIVQLVHQITDPLVEPVRRFMPRTGWIDLSPMIVLILLWLMVWVVNSVSD
ncbi:MAG: hypothetical protein CL897_02440 [Dehalococcoidia bacterium]|nr:hypothetical protein [Dehalococcoidia bacterium]HCV00822.1 YggT family protein [Dehalococcoidia bacterium]